MNNLNSSQQPLAARLRIKEHPNQSSTTRFIGPAQSIKTGCRSDSQVTSPIVINKTQTPKSMVTDQTNSAAIGYAIQLRNKVVANTASSNDTALVHNDISQVFAYPHKNSDQVQPNDQVLNQNVDYTHQESLNEEAECFLRMGSIPAELIQTQMFDQTLSADSQNEEHALVVNLQQQERARNQNFQKTELPQNLQVNPDLAPQSYQPKSVQKLRQRFSNPQASAENTTNESSHQTLQNDTQASPLNYNTIQPRNQPDILLMKEKFMQRQSILQSVFSAKEHNTLKARKYYVDEKQRMKLFWREQEQRAAYRKLVKEQREADRQLKQMANAKDVKKLAAKIAKQVERKQQSIYQVERTLSTIKFKQNYSTAQRVRQIRMNSYFEKPSLSQQVDGKIANQLQVEKDAKQPPDFKMLTQLNEDIQNSPINLQMDYKTPEPVSLQAKIYHMSPNALRREMIDHNQAIQVMNEIIAKKEAAKQKTGQLLSAQKLVDEKQSEEAIKMKRFERQMNVCLSKILNRRKTFQTQQGNDSIEQNQRDSSR